MTDELIIGLMSGTSADGIDAALVDFASEKPIKVVATNFTPYPRSIQKRINALGQKKHAITAEDYQSLDTELAQLYSQACIDLITQEKLDTNRIRAIANHGQTIAHEPHATPPYSLQIGSGQAIANTTGIEVISQFRQADLAAGGQGAPLMPAFHKAVFGVDATEQSTFILNLGGIANLSYLGETTIGFDTGPANTLLNQWINLHQNLDFDDRGNWAKQGRVDPKVLSRLLEDPFLKQPFPKSTGPDYFNLEWLENVLEDFQAFQPVDIQATLLAFTVESIAVGLDQILQTLGEERIGQIFVCGGGANNEAMLSALESKLPQFRINKTNELGVPSDWVEAIGFAWLGYCHLHEINSNLPSVTGANKPLVLGESFKPEVFKPKSIQN